MTCSYLLCDAQGDLYETAAREGYDFPCFSDVLLRSHFCWKYLDTEYSRFQTAGPGDSMDYLLMEAHDALKKRSDGLFFDPDVANWIGFCYRHLYLHFGIDSEKLADMIPFDDMVTMYPMMHTVDEELCAEKIGEAYGLKHREVKPSTNL